MLRFLASMALALAVMFALILGLGGCATVPGPYWFRTHDPIIVSDVREVPYPCGRRDTDGCFRRNTGVIELRAGMPAALRACTLTHELKHAAGYSHRDGPHYSTDCGGGTFYVARGR